MQVLVSRPGTSGGWQECILNRFVDANPDYPFRFIQFTNLLRLGLVWDFSDTSRRQYLASKGRCQSNSVVRPLALTLRRTGPLKCLLTVFQSLNSGIHTRRKRCSFVLAKFLSPSGFSMFCKSCIYRYTTTPFPTKRCRNIEQWSAFQICCLVWK